MSAPRAVVGTAVAATIAAVFPGFLSGALAVQVSAEFDVSEGTYGWALGAFFLGATAGSIGLGRLVQRIGPRLQISASLGLTAGVQLAIATVAQSFGAIVALLTVAGFVNAANQTAVNLVLSRAQLSRLGLAIALKQSGMPAAALLSGLAVPALALTIGWRWTFVAGAAFALLALILVRRTLAPVPRSERTVGGRLVSSQTRLVLAAVAGGLMAYSAGALTSWLVSSGVDAGLGEGPAALLLSVGAASGIALRLISGSRLDAMRARPMAVAASTMIVGATGMFLLAARTPSIHVLATLLAFAGGWIWPVFTNFGIVRRNPDAAGAATGITQTGVYVGVFLAPLVTGRIIERWGYSTMWISVAFVAISGALLFRTLADDF